jgi:hypothetical protein
MIKLDEFKEPTQAAAPAHEASTSSQSAQPLSKPNSYPVADSYGEILVKTTPVEVILSYLIAISMLRTHPTTPAGVQIHPCR